MIGFQPMLFVADIAELLGSIVGLFALVMWVIKQIVDANRKAGPPPGQQPAAPRPQPRPQQPVRANPADQQADPLRNQVEEFLRRSGRLPQANRPAPQANRGRPSRTNEIEVLVGESDMQRERPPLAKPLQSSQPAAGSPSLRGPQPAARPVEATRRQSVAEHVAATIAEHSREVGEQASRLGQRIIVDDQQFDEQLKAKFEHTVGTLTGSAVVEAELAAAAANRAATPAAQIAALLSNPEGVRQAIVVNEILRPPMERW